MVQAAGQEYVAVLGVGSNRRDPVSMANKSLQPLLCLHIGHETVQVLTCRDKRGRGAIEAESSHGEAVIGETRLKRASLHVVEVDNAVDVSCSCHCAAP